MKQEAGRKKEEEAESSKLKGRGPSLNAKPLPTRPFGSAQKPVFSNRPFLASHSNLPVEVLTKVGNR